LTLERGMQHGGKCRNDAHGRRDHECARASDDEEDE
jgi:hypothetical protein